MAHSCPWCTAVCARDRVGLEPCGSVCEIGCGWAGSRSGCLAGYPPSDTSEGTIYFCNIYFSHIQALVLLCLKPGLVSDLCRPFCCFEMAETLCDMASMSCSCSTQAMRLKPQRRGSLTHIYAEQSSLVAPHTLEVILSMPCRTKPHPSFVA